jgi:hypothetical protein
MKLLVMKESMLKPMKMKYAIRMVTRFIGFPISLRSSSAFWHFLFNALFTVGFKRYEQFKLI